MIEGFSEVWDKSKHGVKTSVEWSGCYKEYKYEQNTKL